MKHELLFLGKTKDTFISAGIQEYSSRLQHYTRVSLKTLKEKKCSKTQTVPIEQEGEQFLQAVSTGAVVVALDAGGKQITSEGLAELISGWEQRGVKEVSYIIGGHLGLAAKVIARADMCLSLSLMTFTHDMARMLLLEQIYRAYTIKAGEKYHK